jgi:hypothetical protein
VKRAEPIRPSHARKGVSPRFELDRAWLWRGAAVAIAIVLLFLIAKVSMMAFGGANQRLQRFDPGHEPVSAAPRSSEASQ